jgi:hypothetical protein
MHVQTDHQIIGGAGDRMILVDSNSFDAIVSAERINGVWTLEAAKHKNVKVPAAAADQPPRGNVIKAMVDLALKVSPNDGYSTLVPHGLEWLP